MAEELGENELQALQEEHDATLDELERYKLLVESVQDYAIFLLDSRGHIQTWNKGAQRIKGYKPNEIIGRHFSTFYPAIDKKAHKPENELIIARQVGRVEDEGWRVRKDGTRFWASVVITALYDKTDTLVGFAKVTRDLTERKMHEDELHRANTLLLSQQEELKILNQSKDEFVSLASHQLRTPASAVKQLLGLFVDGYYPGVDEAHMEMIKKAYQSNERQIAIVNSLLKVAQIDSGKVILTMARIDVNAMLKELVESFKETLGQRDQTSTLTPFVPALVVADAQYLRMAIENLVSNASKYTPRGGSIDIAVSRHEDMLKISIKDSGVGIARKDIGSLFEKFGRIPNELSEEVGGTGLGLYWANRVILLHNGHIEVESKPKKGTTFAVFLPIVTRSP